MFRQSLIAGVMLLFVPQLRADVPPAPVRVPFEMLAKGRNFSGHIAVKVKINDKGPFRLIFDTGAPTMLLTSKVAKESGLIGAGAKKPAARGPFAMPGQVTIGKLEIGDVSASDVPAVILDHPTVKAIADVFGPIEGIVGFPFFARFKTSIDYQAKEFTFVPNGYKPADVMQSLMTTLMTRSRDRGKAPPPKMLVPAAQWGLRVEKSESDDEPGVVVAEVMPESAAEQAGIQIGDRLLTLDGHWTDTVADVFTAAAAIKAGQKVELRLTRNCADMRIRMSPRAGF
jgi:hypothetical protein